MSIINSPWTFLEAGNPDAAWNAGRPLTIAAGGDDLCAIYSADDSTVSTPRADAIRAAHLIAAAPELAMTLEMLVDTIESDRDLRREYAALLDCAERVLRRAHGAKA